MSRQTSVQAYHQIRNEGLLTKLKLQVYETLYQHGPLTAGELCGIYFPKTPRPSLSPRFAELEELGVVKTVGVRPCQKTQRNAYVWDVTDQVPRKLEKELVESSKQKIERLEARVQELEEENEFLLAELKSKPRS